MPETHIILKKKPWSHKCEILKQTNTYTNKHPVKTVISIKRVSYQVKLALHYTYDFMSKHSCYIVLGLHLRHLNPWIDLIIAVASDKIWKTILKSSV